MYIIVKYGAGESLLCNPNSAVVNLLASIKSRTGLGHTDRLLDLSDETGLVKDLDLHKSDYATKYLTSHGVYILVEKQIIPSEDTGIMAEDGNNTPSPPQFSYVPLLDNYSEEFPNYKVHVTHVIEKKRKTRNQSKSPSPAGIKGKKGKKGTSSRRR